MATRKAAADTPWDAVVQERTLGGAPRHIFVRWDVADGVDVCLAESVWAATLRAALRDLGRGAS